MASAWIRIRLDLLLNDPTEKHLKLYQKKKEWLYGHMLGGG